MKVYKDIKQKTSAWFDLRRGRISGTKLKNLVTRPLAWRRAKGEGRKIEYYQQVADKLGVVEAEASEEESAMHKGTRREELARERFEKESGKTVTEAGFCTHSEHPDLSFSPDGLILNGDKYTEDTEIKCLGAARHLQAFIENHIPQEYEAQNMQAFIVNEDLERRHFVFFNPDVKDLQYHCIVIERKDILEKIEFYKEAELAALVEIAEMVKRIKSHKSDSIKV